MTTAVLDRKLDRSFGHMDVDRDGYVERSDALGLGARILVGFGETPTSIRGKALIDRFDELWTALLDRIDTNRDGHLSPEEYRAGMRAAFVNGPDFDRVFHPAAQAVAELCDTDQDGEVAFEEFNTALAAFGTEPADADTAFRRLDTNSSGRLTVDELVNAVREFYTSEQSDATGNWLFGPLE